MFAHEYINICAQQLGGVNICCVPVCIHISQFIWAIRQGSPVRCQWARLGRSCTGLWLHSVVLCIGPAREENISIHAFVFWINQALWQFLCS